jgi:hypothetical protein
MSAIRFGVNEPGTAAEATVPGGEFERIDAQDYFFFWSSLGVSLSW